MFVVVEGSDGSGKSTAVAGLIDRLDNDGRKVLHYREPGGTSVGEEIRDVLLKPRDEDIDPITEILLFFAARRQGIVNFIEANPDCIIISDRFVGSSYVYQVIGRGVDINLYDTLVHHVLGDLTIDLSFFIDTPPDVIAKRLKSRDQLDRIELSGKEYFDRIDMGFRNLANDKSKGYIRVSGDQPPEHVVDDLYNRIISSI